MRHVVTGRSMNSTASSACAGQKNRERGREGGREGERERERETGAARMSREEGQPLPLAPEQSTETQRERALNY